MRNKGSGNRKEGGRRVEQGPKQKGTPGILGAAVVLWAVLVLCLAGDQSRAAPASARAELDLPRTTAQVLEETTVGKTVIPMGRAVGIKLFSDGVLVVGLSPVDTQQGEQYPGRDCGLKTGDVITHMDGDEVDTIEQVQQLLEEKGSQPVTIQAMRGQQQLQLTAAAVRNSQGISQLGVWLRDSMAGIGTMTFYDPDSGVVAALGHGINDEDTAMLMPLESGSIMQATVADVQKGVSGQPGELHGQFDLKRDLGSLYANTDRGIFGQLSDTTMVQGLQEVEVADPKQVHTGAATILSNIQGDQVEEYEIQITHVSTEGDGTRSLMLQVTDPRLLQTTGGIVQGMSGSPILQDGRLVGAVTHVLVNDPTRGYGIFAQTMCQAAGN